GLAISMPPAITVGTSQPAGSKLGESPTSASHPTALCVKRGDAHTLTTFLYVAARGAGQQPSRRSPRFKERGAAPAPARRPRHRRGPAHSPYKERAGSLRAEKRR